MTSLSVGGGGGSIGTEVGDIEERGRGKASCRRGEEERGKKTGAGLSRTVPCLGNGCVMTGQ
jgi:hypothetical protein